MKSIKRIFFLLSFISVSYLSTFAQENQSYFLHTIEKGQSLYSISSMYGVSKADIIRLNPGCEDKIYAGQAIKIPQNKTAQKGETFHTIQPGETLYRLTPPISTKSRAPHPLLLPHTATPTARTNGKFAFSKALYTHGSFPTGWASIMSLSCP